MAPEVARIIEVPWITEKSDIFSLGCILYYLFTGKKAFTGNEKDEKAIEEKIKNLQRRVNKSNPEFSLLFKNLLQLDPSKRWSFNEILAKVPKL